MASWYFQKNGTQVGPISDAELRQAALSGSIGEDTQIRNETSAWTSARSTKGLKFAEPVEEQVFYTHPPVPKAVEKTAKKKKIHADYGFTSFATPVLVKLIWYVAIFVAVIATGVTIIMQFATGYPVNGVIALVGMPIASAVVLLLIRVSLESVMVLFSIDASLKKLVDSE